MAKSKVLKSTKKPKPRPKAPRPSTNDKKQGEEEPSPSRRRPRGFKHSLANSLNVPAEEAQKEFLEMTDEPPKEPSPAEEHFLGEEEHRPVDEKPAQLELVKAEEPKEPEPEVVVEGRVSMHLVNFRVSKNKQRDLEMTMILSLDLRKEHEGHLPVAIQDAWHDLEQRGYTSVEPPHLENQNVAFFIDPKYSPIPDLESLVELESAFIETVQEKGKGKSRNVTRLTMRMVMDLTDDVIQFCLRALDENVFAKIEAVQRSLEEKAPEEAAAEEM